MTVATPQAEGLVRVRGQVCLRTPALALQGSLPIINPCGKARPIRRFKRVDNATALIWRLLLVAEKRFRKLNAPQLLGEVYEGRRFEDGKPVPEGQERIAA
ncbi:hypothetical protein [Candidatus Palauibacter sp.]|uniref:hypothetical protein n=1 Tax=Candidatus Palauibacter sp. TaxID=3101350 RepID=UPI003B52B3A2